MPLLYLLYDGISVLSLSPLSDKSMINSIFNCQQGRVMLYLCKYPAITRVEESFDRKILCGLERIALFFAYFLEKFTLRAIAHKVV